MIVKERVQRTYFDWSHFLCCVGAAVGTVVVEFEELVVADAVGGCGV
jgi:hypothetical protein